MKRMFSIFFIIIFVLVGYSEKRDSITEKDARALVIEKNTDFNNVAHIVSLEVKDNEYYIKWENKSLKISGTDKVKKDGDIEVIEEVSNNRLN